VSPCISYVVSGIGPSGASIGVTTLRQEEAVASSRFLPSQGEMGITILNEQTYNKGLYFD